MDRKDYIQDKLESSLADFFRGEISRARVAGFRACTVEIRGSSRVLVGGALSLLREKSDFHIPWHDKNLILVRIRLNDYC